VVLKIASSPVRCHEHLFDRNIPRNCSTPTSFVEDADALYTEFADRGAEFTRELAHMPWNSREFVVKDYDGRLLAFGTNL